MRGLVAEEGNLAVVDFGTRAEFDVSKKRLAQMLSRSTRWIEQRVGEGMPSTLDRRGRRMFSPSECRSWLAENGRSVA
jgi:hypothetical protein